MTPKQEAALRLALEALEFYPVTVNHWKAVLLPAAQAIREALAEQPAQVDPCIDGSCSCCWTHLDEQPAHVAAVNTSSERVDKTAENVHEQPAQQQEPVAWIEHGSNEVPSIVVWERGGSGHYTPLYTSPRPSKPWVGLTPAEAGALWKVGMTPHEFSCAIEAKLKEKNT